MRRADRPFLTIEEDKLSAGFEECNVVNDSIVRGKGEGCHIYRTTVAGKTHLFSETFKKHLLEGRDRIIKIDTTATDEAEKIIINKKEDKFSDTHDAFTYALGEWLSPSVVFKENGEVVVESSINKDAVKLPSMFEVMVKFQNRRIEFETYTSKSGRKKIEVKDDIGSMIRGFEIFPHMTESQCVKELLYKISAFDGLARRDYIEYYGEEDLNKRLEL